MLKFFLFGPPHLHWQEKPLEVSLRKGLALLVYLAVTGQPHSRDTLATLFWPEGSQRGARANLRRLLYDLNQLASIPLLETNGDTVRLHSNQSIWLDVEQFRAALKAQMPTFSPNVSPVPILSEPAFETLAEAAELYTDDFMAGFTLEDCPDFDDWQFFQREELRRDYAALLHQLSLTHEAQGRLGEAAHLTRRRLLLDPLEESGHRRLMELYARAGQRSAALRQYEECVRILAEELGAEPEAETTACYEAIRTRRFPSPATPTTTTLTAPTSTTTIPTATLSTATISTGPEVSTGVVPAPEISVQAVSTPAVPALEISAMVPAAMPPEPQTATLPAHNLPMHTTPFIGRKHEVAEVLRRLAEPDCRLLTLVGPGGIGKTRLAIEAARRLTKGVSADHLFQDGVFFVSLQTATNSKEMAEALAAATEFQFSGSTSPQAQLLNYLKDKQLLLLLDNFEHLLEGVEVVIEILSAAPGVKLLVTSREALKLQEEWFHPLAGMRLPPQLLQGEKIEVGEYDAVQLFIQTARRAVVDFRPEPNYAHIVRICRLVDGMPLAIELAATWLKALPPERIAAEIEQSLDVLSTTLQNIPERHRSVRVVFDHTWLMLTPEERTVFERLAVFHGGFTHQAANQVTGASLLTLSQLVDKSLLLPDTHERFQIHDLLRQYAEDKLRATPDVLMQTRDRHCDYFADFLHRLTPALKGGAQLAAVDSIESELDNVRAAWNWGTEGNRFDAIRQSAQALFIFYHCRSRYQEAAAAFGQAVHALTPQAETHAERHLLMLLCVYQTWFLMHLRRMEEAASALQQSRALQATLTTPSYSIYLCDPALPAGILAFWQGEYTKIGQYGEEALERSIAHANPWNRQVALYLLGRAARVQGNYTQALAHLKQALDLSRGLGDQWFSSFCHEQMAANAYICQDYELAKEHYTASRDLGRQMRYSEGSARALNGLATVALHQGNFAEAERLFSEALASHQQILNAGGVAAARMGLGNTILALGDIPAAARHFEQALHLVQQTHAQRALILLLVGIGHLLLLAGDEQRGLDVLMLAAHHPAGDMQIRTEVQTVLARLHKATTLVQPSESWSEGSDLWQTHPMLLVELSLRLRTLADEPA